MATPKKSVTKASKGTKRARRNPKRTWNVYVSRSLRSINSQMSMTSRDNEDRELLCERPVRAHCDGGSDNCAREQEAHAGRTRTTDSVRLCCRQTSPSSNGGGHQGGVTRVQLDAMHTYMRYSRDKGPLRAPPLTVSRTPAFRFAAAVGVSKPCQSTAR
ncbi:hypothetical protein ERJ75_001685500 [Trypanosoma vivax]|nr:hypothetical protein ERJ75_001685500 [Trypanosoma vivax]